MTNFSDVIWQIATVYAEATVHRVPLHGFNCTINRKFTMIDNTFSYPYPTTWITHKTLDYTRFGGASPRNKVIEGLDVLPPPICGLVFELGPLGTHTHNSVSVYTLTLVMWLG
jgi:hypothetical protein